jgi:addiction module RelE/StbE family toxin
MRRDVVPTGTFLRDAKRLAKRDPSATARVQATLEQLAEDAFHPALKTHPLKGRLAGRYGCRGGFDLRIVFRFAKDVDSESIELLAVGTHEDVY